MSFRMTPEMHRAVKLISLDERASVQSLLEEAVGLLLAKPGGPVSDEPENLTLRMLRALDQKREEPAA